MKLDIDDEASVERRRELATQDSNLTALLSHKHHMSSSVAAVVALNHHLHPAPPTDATLCGRLARCCGRAPAADAEQPAAPSIPPPTPTVLRSLGAARTVDALRAHTRDGAFRGGGVRPPRDACRTAAARQPATEAGAFAAVAAAMARIPTAPRCRRRRWSALRGLCTGTDDVGRVRKQLAHVLGTFPLAVAAMAAHGAADAAVAVAGCGLLRNACCAMDDAGLSRKAARRRRARSRRRPPRRAHPHDAELARVALGLLRERLRPPTRSGARGCRPRPMRAPSTSR